MWQCSLPPLEAVVGYSVRVARRCGMQFAATAGSGEKQYSTVEETMIVLIPTTGSTGEVHLQRSWKTWMCNLLPVEAVLNYSGRDTGDVPVELAFTESSGELPSMRHWKRYQCSLQLLKAVVSCSVRDVGRHVNTGRLLWRQWSAAVSSRTGSCDSAVCCQWRKH